MFNWEENDSVICDTLIERVYLDASGAAMRVRTRCNKYGEWGTGKVTYEFGGQKYTTEEALRAAIERAP